jgi:hypothetical protein
MLDTWPEPSEIWEGRTARNVLRDEYASWLPDIAPWMVMVTLTFREETYPDVARHLFLRLVRALNEDVLGCNYRRIVGHSYFSYVLATEYQSRGVIHFHFLADRPINFRLLHELWNKWAGFALTELIRDPARATRYIAKYMVKENHPDLSIAKKRIYPFVLPPWWMNPGEGSGAGQVASEKGVVDTGGGSTGRPVEVPGDTSHDD